jgi:hypothetical protein
VRSDGPATPTSSRIRSVSAFDTGSTARASTTARNASSDTSSNPRCGVRAVSVDDALRGAGAQDPAAEDGRLQLEVAGDKQSQQPS